MTLERRVALERRARLARSAPLRQLSENGRAVERLWRYCRKVILKRDGHRCRRCGWREREPFRTVEGPRFVVLAVAHILPKGSWPNIRFEPANLLAMCSWCHTDGPEAWHRRPLLVEAWVAEHLGSAHMDYLRDLARNRMRLDLDDARIFLEALEATL